jgi:hypothetical protein
LNLINCVREPEYLPIAKLLNVTIGKEDAAWGGLYLG